MRTSTLYVAAAFCASVACARCAAAQATDFGGPTMGTAYRVRLAFAPSDAEMASFKREIEALLAEIDRQMSTYRADSELSRFNRAPPNKWFPVSDETAEVVTAAQRISTATEGVLDITVGPLVELWHMGPGGAIQRAQPFPAMPSAESISTAMSTVGYDKLKVRLRPPALRKDLPGLAVDLSSIAPGYTVDRMFAILRDQGIDHFIVELGGEVRAQGLRADGRPWRIAIERPQSGRHEMLHAVSLRNAAISTAGDYRKFFAAGGRRYSHIIDPRTGRPIEHSLASVTVVADTCLEADGWDTPLLVLGPKRGYQCAVDHDIAALFVSYEAEKEVVQTTPAWDRRFRPSESN